MLDIPLTGSLEENILTMLCWDATHAATIALRVTSSTFSTPLYRKIARTALQHLEQWHTPTQVHLKDIFEEQLANGDEGVYLGKILDRMEELYPSLQPDYVIETLERFITIRRLSDAVHKTADLLEAGKLSEAQEALLSPDIRPKHSPGIWLTDSPSMLSFLDKKDADYFSSGIRVLDERRIRPERKEMMLFIAPKGKGKSWFLVNIGKHALIHNKSVLHITCEMGEERVAQRYIQSLFSMCEDEGETIRIPTFQRDESGVCSHIDFDILSPMEVSERNRGIIANKLKIFATGKPPLLIKGFPSGTLTMPMLNSYLDSLEMLHNFRPDMLILDYIGITNTGNSKEKRIGLGENGVAFRAILQERNMAGVTAHQGNRSSLDAKIVTASMTAEDITLIQTADNVITYSQTKAEYDFGVARILVENARYAKDHFFALISQAYGVGQFCLDSAYMTNDLSTEVKRITGVD